MEKIISLTYNWRTDALGNEHSERFDVDIDDVLQITEEADYGHFIGYNVLFRNGSVTRIHNPNAVGFAIPERIAETQPLEDLPF